MFSNFKKRLGVLAAIAVLAALVPALSVSPASAALKSGLLAIAPQADATYDSCPSTSAAAAGFTDTTSTDVDCIKTHGITQGVTATTYEPSGTVPRWQMALFLTRMATSAGLTLGSGADQGFTDISGYAADIQTAINQIKQLGVTTGTTATTYSPDDNVTREQMAMFIERLLGVTTPGPGACSGIASAQTNVCTAVSGVTNVNILSSADADVANWNYTDIDSGSVTYEGHNAIVELYHLGVPGDAKTDLTFRPTANITRAEMATFMKNALDHTNARPEGLWLQVNLAAGFGALGTELHISSRDASRNPITGTLVDVFSGVNTVLTTTSDFGATGACVVANTTDIGGATECTIAVGDASTDVYGNVNIANASVADVATGTSVTYYGWTGTLAATYNNLTAPGSSATTSSSLAAGSVKLTTDLGTKRQLDGTDTTAHRVKYGETVTVTGQLIDGVAASLANVAQANVAYSIAETVHLSTDAGDGTITHNNEDSLISAKTTTGVTDASGAFTYTVTQADPAVATTNRTLVTLTVTTSPAAVYATTSNTTMLFSFDDDAAWNAKVSASQNAYYGVGSAVSPYVSRTVSAVVYDQYGVTRAGQTVTFESVSTDGAATTDAFTTQDVDRVTDSTGTATFGYVDVNTDTTMQTISAYLDDGYGAGTANDNANAAAEKSDDTVFYRIEAAPTSQTEVDNALLATNELGADNATFTVDIAGGAKDGLWTLSAAHAALVVGSSIIVTTGTTQGLAGIPGVGPMPGEVFYLLTDNSSTTFTASRTRGGSLVNFAADQAAGKAKKYETWDVGDVWMEIVRWDDATNTLVISEQTTAAGSDDSLDYFAFTYEADDQFLLNADLAANPQMGALGLAPTSTTLAGFETALKGKMNILTGYVSALANTEISGTLNDVYTLSAKNHLADPGVSTIGLGH